VAFKQVVYTRSGLSLGNHRIIIKCQGGGQGLSLDALDVTGWLNEAQRTTRVQQTDGSFVHTGTWTTSGTWSASGFSYTSTSTAGAKVEYGFTGSYCALVARTGPMFGKAKITLDPLGANIVTIVDLYSATNVWKKMVYNTGLLANGAHVIRVEYTGTKYWASSGRTINVDCVDMLGPILW
jgi:hypothetical protein